MKPGDLVIYYENYGLGIGLVLDVEVDQAELKVNRLAAPWRYTVFWSNGEKRIHETGVLRRIAIA